jgi:hypothetical protein
MPGDHEQRIVADGPARERAAFRDEISRGVRAKYAGELARAGFLRRLRLRITIRREIAHELARRVPGDGLFLKPGSRGPT